MKKLLVCLSTVVLSGCGIGEVGPKYKVLMYGSHIKETGNDLHIFSRTLPCDDLPQGITYQDTLSVDGKLYNQVFFVRIIPKKLHKNYRNLDLELCEMRNIFSKEDTVRKQVPGFGERKFLVVENVVGVQ